MKQISRLGSMTWKKLSGEAARASSHLRIRLNAFNLLWMQRYFTDESKTRPGQLSCLWSVWLPFVEYGWLGSASSQTQLSLLGECYKPCKAFPMITAWREMFEVGSGDPHLQNHFLEPKWLKYWTDRVQNIIGFIRFHLHFRITSSTTVLENNLRDAGGEALRCHLLVTNRTESCQYYLDNWAGSDLRQLRWHSWWRHRTR